jgi:arginine/serine-rich splicing factor 12
MSSITISSNLSPHLIASLQHNPHINPTLLQYDPMKAEEVARTVYVGNLPRDITDMELRELLKPCGTVSYVKLAGDITQATRYGFVEFTDISGTHRAVQMSGIMFKDRQVK